MSLIDDIRNDIAAAKELRLPRRGILSIIVGSLPIYWLFDHFGKLSMALPALNFVAVFAFLIALKWRFRRRIWFWALFIVLAAFHVELILFIPWTNSWVPALAIAVIDSADFCLIVWIFAAVGRLMEGPKASGMSRHSR